MKHLVVSVGKHIHLFRTKWEFIKPVRLPEEAAYCIVNDLKGKAAFLVATWNEFPLHTQQYKSQVVWKNDQEDVQKLFRRMT